MNIFEVRLGMTFNIGQYESERIDLAATVPDDESIAECIAEMRNIVVGSSSKGAKLSQETSQVHLVKETTEGLPLPSKDAVITPLNDEIAVGNEGTVPTAPAQDATQSNTEEAPKKAKRGPKAKAAESKPAPSKTVAYDRNNDIHKNIMGTLLDGIDKDWRKSSTMKEKAVQASKDLVGAEFLTSQGDVLQSFKDVLIEKLK